MEFLDYEKIIRDNYPIMIESYVKQYGEEYREHITSVLNRAKYCIFESPLTISEYVKRKINEDFMKAILDSYVCLGIDISNIKIDEEGFIFDDKKIGELTVTFFPVIDSYEKIRTRGIFSFNDEFDDLEIDHPIFKERIGVLERLNLKDPEISVEEFIKSDKYKHYCGVFRDALGIILECILCRCSDDYDAYIKYSDELEEKINLISKEYERKYFFKIREYLCDSDKELLDSGRDVKELRDYYLYFDDTLPKDNYAFSEGVLEFFCDYYTDVLMNKHASKTEKDEVIEKRREYLKRNGFDLSLLDNIDLYCDWGEISCLEGFLPDLGYASECLLRRDLIVTEYEWMIAKACIINGYDLKELDSEVGTIIDSDGHSCSFDIREFDCDNPIPIICISPLNGDYSLFDIALDHELRHAIEMSIKKKKNSYLVKMGTDISEVDFNFDSLKSGFTNYNERVTQKLSIEACRERWMKGQFIFSDPYSLINTCCISCYDYDIDNLDIIFNPFRDELIHAQISSDFDEIYRVIPKSLLRKVNSNISNHTKRGTKILTGIRDELLEGRHISSNKVKKLDNNN